ncbi:MAG: hypothetical protein PHI40_04725 [Caldisericia bacterium]|nr:hypothetical protein [Caldisericia bacterium]MDD4614697.1 hypothetical protein [Caldisericia bacterium]
MAIQRCSTEEEIKTALQESQMEVSSDELDLVLDEFESVYDDPVAVTLANYMEALDSIIYEQCGDWVDYIDYVRYMKDLIENEENQFSLVKINDGYCIVYQDLPENMDDDEDEEEEECEIDLPEV